MDYIISGSSQTVYAKNTTTVTAFGYVISSGESNTIYLAPYIGAAPSYGTNHIYGVGKYNILQYFQSPGPVTVDVPNGVAHNGWGGTDYFSGMTNYQLSPYADTVIGGDGGELFCPGTGNDLIDGGAGVDAVSYYSEPSSNYQIQYDHRGDIWTVTKGLQVQTFHQIEEVQFGDRTLYSPKAFTLPNGAELTYAGAWTPYLAQTEKSMANWPIRSIR